MRFAVDVVRFFFAFSLTDVSSLSSRCYFRCLMFFVVVAIVVVVVAIVVGGGDGGGGVGYFGVYAYDNEW